MDEVWDSDEAPEMRRISSFRTNKHHPPSQPPQPSSNTLSTSTPPSSKQVKHELINDLHVATQQPQQPQLDAISTISTSAWYAWTRSAACCTCRATTWWCAWSVECDADIKAASLPCPYCNEPIDREESVVGLVVA